MRITLLGQGSLNLRDWRMTHHADGTVTIIGRPAGDGITVPPPWTAPCPSPEGDDWQSVAVTD